MTNCKEFILDDMMAIIAIPVSDISASDVESPVNKLTPRINAEDFDAVPLDNAIVIGRQAATEDGVVVHIMRQTGKAKDDPQDSVAGRLHTVTVNCEIDERDGVIWTEIPALDNTPCNYRLERMAHHLLLTFRDGTRGFVSATNDTYLCTIERDGAKVGVQFRIQNLTGVQMLY